MNKIFITGGAGLIGAATAEYVLQHGMQARTFDTVAPQHVHGEHVVGSIMDVAALKNAMQSCDVVIHLAALLGVKRTEENRVQCLDLNIGGTKNVLDACMSAGVKRIVFSSSAEVYGTPEKSPIQELDPMNPRSLYAITKLAGEEYIKAYHGQYGLDYAIARFFNVYGPGQALEFVLPIFVNAVMSGKGITITGTGEQTRSFCYVEDAAEALYLLARNENASAETFNIANADSVVSIKELAETVVRLSGKQAPIRFEGVEGHVTSRPERMQNLPDTHKALAFLGFTPKISLEEGIARIVRHG